VASRYVLDQPAVAAVIVGARDGRHLGDTLRIGSLKLTDEDAAGIGAVLALRTPCKATSMRLSAIGRAVMGPS
jgi:aryl-alcohol dehydrogenase-like predicted oxidoreductase